MKIIHRDLKPENIMIASDGIIKIGDFGISKLMTTEEQSKTYGIGTQKFMAPEIIDENNDYNEKVDVYSFGVLMFYMLNNGEMPVLKMSDKMTGKKAKIPSGFTDFSRDLINNCWNFQSKDRPSFAEMIDDMEKNNYSIVELSKSELNEIKLLIKQHKEKMPSYSA